VAQAPGGQPIRQTSTNPPPAPSTTTAPPPAPTRVAVVNINKVLKDYKRAQKLNNDIKEKVQQYAQKMDLMRKRISESQAQMTHPTTPPQQREQIEKNILALNRELQDLDNQARKDIGKEQGEIAVAIFKEIEGVIQAVAATNNFDLVLSYPDATDPNEQYLQDNIVRKLAAQAAMPLFYKPHIDLTPAVITTLNYRYPVAAAPGTAPSTAAPAR
jgi:Skp family chaperone for outer membrane proteins